MSGHSFDAEPDYLKLCLTAYFPLLWRLKARQQRQLGSSEAFSDIHPNLAMRASLFIPWPTQKLFKSLSLYIPFPILGLSGLLSIAFPQYFPCPGPGPVPMPLNVLQKLPGKPPHPWECPKLGETKGSLYAGHWGNCQTCGPQSTVLWDEGQCWSLQPQPRHEECRVPTLRCRSGAWRVGGRHFKMPQHSLPTKQQCVSSPKLASGWKFLTGFQCSSRVCSDSFRQLISCFSKGMEPGSSYFASFDDVPAPWAYS